MKGLRTLQPSVKALAPSLSQPATVPTFGQGRGGRPWRALRLRILQRDRWMCQCEDCEAQNLVTLADEVDHIIPLSQGGTDDERNLRAINGEHHKLKTARESKGG